MDDFMDSLVREVEGNIRPIRSERMEDFSVEPAPVYYDAQDEPAPVYYESRPVRGRIPSYTEVPSYGYPGMTAGTARQIPPVQMAPVQQAMPRREMPPVQQTVPIREMTPPPQPVPAPQPVQEQPPVQPQAVASAGSSASSSGNSGTEGAGKLERDLFLHVHRENVKCYRNTQATIIENTNLIRQAGEDNHSNLHGWLVGLLVLSIINLGASALMILHMIFGFI